MATCLLLLFTLTIVPLYLVVILRTGCPDRDLRAAYVAFGFTCVTLVLLGAGVACARCDYEHLPKFLADVRDVLSSPRQPCCPEGGCGKP